MTNRSSSLVFILVALTSLFLLGQNAIAGDPAIVPVTQLPTGTLMRMYKELYLPPVKDSTEGELTLISDDWGNLMWVHYAAKTEGQIISANTVFTLTQVQTVAESAKIVDGELTLSYGDGQSLNLFCRTRQSDESWAPCKTDLLLPSFEIRLPD